jgi:hypothetical protein
MDVLKPLLKLWSVVRMTKADDVLAAIGGILLGITLGMLGIAIIEAIIGVECPNCGYRVKRNNPKCPNCGIGLVWG